MTDIEHQRIHLDYETFSEVDIRDSGHIKYAKDPSTEVLMAAYCIGEDEVKHWDATKDEIPDELYRILLKPQYVRWAHNASFEIAITCYALVRRYPMLGEDIRTLYGSMTEYIKTWRCSMVQGMAMSMGGTLKMQGEILRVPETKLADSGMRLIRKFCVPRRPSKNNPSVRWRPEDAPEDWQDFVNYNIMDVVAERANWRRTSKFSLPEHEWDAWHLDQRINFSGLPIDEDLVDSAIQVGTELSEKLKKEYADLTNLSNPNSHKQIMPWLQERGYTQDNLRAATVTNLLRDPSNMNPDVLRALQLRQLTSKNAFAKFQTMKNCLDDGHVRGAFLFCGAGRTWRWAGRLIQPHNLPRGIIEPEERPNGSLDTTPFRNAIAAVKTRDLDLISCLYDDHTIPDVLNSLVRPSISARKGRTLTVADLSSIETVMIGWIANSEYMLDLFRNGLDPYKDYATHLYGIEYNEVTKAMRKFCKPPVLGAGYRLGADTLIEYAAQFGVAMTRKEAFAAIDAYRNAYPEIPELWNKIDEALFTCIKTGETVVVNGKFTFRMEKPCFTIELPSGRKLVYIRPRVERREFTYTDRKGVKKKASSECVTYENMNQTTRKWERTATHAGKVVENIDQAISRDILLHGMTLAQDAFDAMGDGARVIGHVHDEILAETPDSYDYSKILVEAMTTPPDWCLDAPLGSSSYQSPFYIKD